MRLPVAVLAAAAAAVAASAPGTLPGSNMPPVHLDANSITVSGISSGGFMAVQMHVAYSSTFHTGVGVLAGGPFWCAQDSVTLALTSCMSDGFTIDTAELQNMAVWTSYWGLADPTSNMKDSRVWVLSAQQDTVVATEVVKKLQEFYTAFNNDPSGNIVGVYNQTGEHSQLTLDYGIDCTTLGTPYMTRCGYDAAGELLQHIFRGALRTPASMAYNGTIYAFDQSVFFDGAVWAAAFGMGKTGYVYVPPTCAAGAPCRLHVALHGCEMTPALIGQQYVQHGGYNAWGDANNMVILYPQAHTNALNPKACWDWWSYSGLAYASNVGAQTLTVKRMVDSLTGAPRTPNGTLCTPAQEAAMAGVLQRAAKLDTSRAAVLQAGRFDDPALNEALDNPLGDAGQRCWPAGGMHGLLPPAGVVPNAGLRGGQGA